MHIPGYQYCGPGTNLEKRLERGDTGINKLDEACKEHDIAYSTKNNANKRTADKQLISKAWKRVKSRDAKIGERTAALAVTGLMKIKSGIDKISGGGKIKSANSKRDNNLLSIAIQKATDSLNKNQYKDTSKAAKVALKAAKTVIKSNKSNKRVKFRIIPVPKTGGILPFRIPLFAGLSAVGSLAGGTAAIINAVNSTKSAIKQLNEKELHNQTMKAISIGNKTAGDGLYLKPYKNGLGIYLKPQPKNH